MAIYITRNNFLTTSENKIHLCFKTDKNELYRSYPLIKDYLASFIDNNAFDFNNKESIIFNPTDSSSLNSIKILGLGEKPSLNLESLFRLCSNITYSLINSKSSLTSFDIVLPKIFKKDEIEKILLGLYYGHYYFDKYKSKKMELKNLNFNIITKGINSSNFDKLNEKCSQIIDGVNMTRLLVNEQPEVLSPKELANYATNIGKSKNITCKIFDEKAIVKNKMLGIWNVGKGSAKPPRFIHLVYKSKLKNKKTKKIALIGKGMTYDSGGLSLKPADYMVTMKMDMAGAGCVMGVFESLSKLQPNNLEVHGLIPSAENMPGPDAYRPDDIVSGLSGKTIEVINTDAEGRVILSDAIEYANRLKVDEMVDLATLTGACMVALGNYTAGLFSNSKKLTDKLLSASHKSCEKLWELPLDEDLRPSIDSNIADVKNSASTRYGGATTAAMFLQFFVDPKIQWSHIDIAGPAYIDSKRNWLAPGATGFGVMTLLKYLGI